MSYITPDIIEVKALEDYKIYIKFETNEEKIYDMKKNISKIEYYKKLKNNTEKHLFNININFCI